MKLKTDGLYFIADHGQLTVDVGVRPALKRLDLRIDALAGRGLAVLPELAVRDLLRYGASKFEAMAIPLYEETIKRAREYGVANDYTRKALERMNIYKPDQYPLLHDPAVELQLEDRR